MGSNPIFSARYLGQPDDTEIIKAHKCNKTEPWQINSNATLKILKENFLVLKENSYKRNSFYRRFRERNLKVKASKDADAFLIQTMKNATDKSQFNWCKNQTELRSRSHFNMRVWSWLRMNAGGVLNTCKSNGLILKPSDVWVSGGRVSNAWRTCRILGDNT